MSRLDLKLLIAIIIIVFGLLINIYMPLNFYINKYLNSMHNFDCGSHFIYFGTFPGGEVKETALYEYAFKLDIKKMCEDEYSVNTTIYLLSGNKIGYERANTTNPFKADNISIVFSHNIIVGEDAEIISVLFPTSYISRHSNYYILLYKEPFRVFANPESIGYVQHYIGLPKDVAEEEAPLISNGSLPPLLYMFYKVGDRYILDSARLGNMDFLMKLIPKDLSLNTTGIWKEGFIDLFYTNTVPANQDWLYALEYEFGLRLYPLPLVLITSGVILVIIRLRQGR